MNENERTEELETLRAIYPELEIHDYTAYLELPVVLSSPLRILSLEQQHEVLHLPAICIFFTLPDDYPETGAPFVQLKAAWLSTQLAAELEAKAARLWKELGGIGILYSYIMEIEEAAEQSFELDELPVEEDLFNILVEYDVTAKRKEFQKSSHECSVCIDTKPGDQCYRMERCGHVFCVDCLKSGYNAAIKDGDIDSIKCLSYNCGAEDLNYRARRAKRIRHISPQELLKIPIDHEKVERYVKLKRKRLLEADRSTIWCPIQSCQGAARENNYPKSTVPLEEMGESDSEDEPPKSGFQNMTIGTTASEVEDASLAICEDCQYAFCTKCRAGWHGYNNGCYGTLSEKEVQRKEERTLKGSEQRRREEEQLSREYLATQTSPCPNCSTPVSKSEACNHIICRQCRAHFCYLCSAVIDADSPYTHFNDEKIACFGRLWVLKKGGDENKVQFGGMRGAEARVRNLTLEAERLRTLGIKARLRLVEEELEQAKEALVRLQMERSGEYAAQ